MAILFGRYSFFSKSHGFLLPVLLLAVAVSHLRPPEVEAAITGPDSRANSFADLEDEVSIVGKSETDRASVTDESSESIGDEEFDGLLREIGRDRHDFPTSDRRRPTSWEIEEKLKKNIFHFVEMALTNFEESMRTEEEVGPAVRSERPIVSPRFFYVAREFYGSWEGPSRPVTDVRETVAEGDENDFWRDVEEKNDDVETESEKKKVGLGWRNIIDAPVSGCPPGERKDRNGRCRMTLW